MHTSHGHRRRFFRSLLAGIALAVSAASSAALTVSGPVRVIDGDTIDVGGERVRLEGIDAPETRQTCVSASGQTWACGRAATKTLRQLVDQATLRCEDRGRDKYGRLLAICFSGVTNINESMVRSGFAWAFVKYSGAFIGAEADARAKRIGVWSGAAEAPWDFRKGAWQTAECKAPAGCAIKGNISKSGRIYHLPWSPWYSKVKVDESSGERWFCSETEALHAGWRAVAGP